MLSLKFGLKSPKKLKVQNTDYVSIHKDEFLPGLALPADVFVQMPGGKMILLAKQGEPSSLHELHVSQNQAPAVFFVRRNDYLIAAEQNLKISNAFLRGKDISFDRKSRTFHTAFQSVMSEFRHLGLTAATFQHAKFAAQSLVILAQTCVAYRVIYKALDDLPNDMTKEAVLGSVLSVMIAKEMGWENPANLEKLALCALLRDIGMLEVAREEHIVDATHCEKGAQLLRTLVDVPPEVSAVALEHHENAVGEGFPRKIRDMKMNPFARIVCLANSFIEFTVARSGNEIPPMESGAALFHIEVTLGAPFNRLCLGALRRVFPLEASSGSQSEAA